MIDAILYALCGACFARVWEKNHGEGDIFSWWWFILEWHYYRARVPGWALKPFGWCVYCLSFWGAVALVAVFCPWPYLPCAFVSPVVYNLLAKIDV